FAGPTVDNVEPLTVTLPADLAVNTIYVTPKGKNGLHGWPVPLTVSDLDEQVEQEPNNEPAKANILQVPGAVTGRFEQNDDSDPYQSAAKRGQKLLMEAHTLELGSPTLVYMVLKNAKGAELGKTNPQAAPPLDQRIEFTAPEDGNYLLEVQHLNYLGGPSEAYRLSVTPSAPGFDLALGIDRYDAAPGSFAAVTVLVTRRGYTGPIEVSVNGPRGVSGKATVPAGQPAQPNQPGALLLLQVAPDVPLGPHTLTLQGKATIDGQTVTQAVSVRAAASQNLAGLPFPPRD